MLFLRLSALIAAVSGIFLADKVTDWNRIMLDALLVPPAPGPLAPRPAAIFQASVFNAVNGIERRFTPIHVTSAAPPGASQRAAAVQVTYASLAHLFPTQIATFDQKRSASLPGIASGSAAENSESIQPDIEWGQTVADAIWAWPSTDGFSNVQPPFVGGMNPGRWRPTLPAFAPELPPQMATMTPCAIASPSQFRQPGPPSLTSAQYTADFNEVKSKGSARSSTRTAEETLCVRFWASATPPDFWDPLAITLSAKRHFTLSENARLLALVNINVADASIDCWDTKYAYDFWRPITAIQLAGMDGNPDTSPDASWTPLLPTPLPDYTSAHSCVSAAAATVLANYFGEDTQFSVASDSMPAVTHYFSSFSPALEEIKNARVFAGIHFRTAANDGTARQGGHRLYPLSALLSVNRQRLGQQGR